MERAMINEAEIWFTTQVAEYLKTPATTIRWWRHVGQGPKSFKLGTRKVAYLRRDVEAWLEEQYTSQAV
jgi:predicted DNA-binding transcriptional regulator AlpA